MWLAYACVSFHTTYVCGLAYSNNSTVLNSFRLLTAEWVASYSSYKRSIRFDWIRLYAYYFDDYVSFFLLLVSFLLQMNNHKEFIS